MKKESLELDEKNVYVLNVLLKNTALMKSATGKTGLINIKTNEIVGSFDNFYTIYSTNGNFYFQERNLEDLIKDSNRSYSKKNLHVRIYDALNEKTVADDLIVISKIKDYNLVILLDPKTKKYHLFQEGKYRTAENTFDTEYDEIKYLYDYYGEQFLSLCKEGKKALYSTKKGLVTPYQYDDIQRIGSATIFTQGNHKFFTCFKNTNENVFTSPMYKDIKGDGNGLIYCKGHSDLSIYCVKDWICKQLFKAPLCDDIECVRELSDSSHYNGLPLEYIFLIKKDNKYGISSGVTNTENVVPFQNLTGITYDEIKFDDGNYFLKKDNKMGLFKGYSKDKHIINAYYDKIVPIKGTNCYELFNGDRCDVFDISNSKTIVHDCKIIQNIYSTVIFEQNGKKGILDLNGNQCVLLRWYDDVQYLGRNYFLVSQRGKKGIIHGTQMLIEPNYESIQVNGFHSYRNLNVLEYADSLYFALKKIDGSYDLAKYMKGKNSWDEKELKYLNVQRYNNIQLYNSIMVLRDNNNTYVYGYDEKLLKTLPATVEIREETIKRGKEEIDLYVVDDVYYFYKDGNFEVAPVEDCKLYVTAYDSDYGTVVVNNYDKDKHDEMCKSIEESDDKSFDDTLIEMYNKNPQIQKKYPTLIKTK